MAQLSHPIPDLPLIPVAGTDLVFPVRRVFCVGRNYAAHAAEMGAEVDREAPFYFTKSAFSVATGVPTIAYPPETADYHHEMEMVVAIGEPAFRVTSDGALGAVFGYGCGLDMTRRDHQAKAKEKRRPWDVGKDVEGSAVLGALARADRVDLGAHSRISLTVNGAVRQDATLGEMVHSTSEIIADLSRFYHLQAGDIIMTGTPAGVGPVEPGDHLVGEVEGLPALDVTIAASGT